MLFNSSKFWFNTYLLIISFNNNCNSSKLDSVLSSFNHDDSLLGLFNNLLPFLNVNLPTLDLVIPWTVSLLVAYFIALFKE